LTRERKQGEPGQGIGTTTGNREVLDCNPKQMFDAIFVAALPPGYERYDSSESGLKNETPVIDDRKVLQILSYRSTAIWTTFFITNPNSGAFTR
jgi:hypothetical protein